jgi:MFS family permease
VSGELRPPNAESTEQTSRYGPMFWTCLAVGGGCMGFGLISLFARAAATDPTNFAVFFVGLALVHDLLLAPAVIVAAWLLRSVTPRPIRGVLFGALAVSAVVAGFSVPFVAGWGAQPDNPSFLPRPYGFGLLVVLAWVWVIALAVAFVRRGDGR